MLVPLVVALCVLAAGSAAQDAIVPGPWHAWLESPGGELPFELELEASPDGLSAAILNGSERIDVPIVHRPSPTMIVFDITHYDARLVATVTEGGRRMDGHWVKRRGLDLFTRLPFAATAGAAPRFAEHRAGEDGALAPAPAGGLGPADAAPPIDGTWAMNFAYDDDPAVGLFTSGPDHEVEGTILTSVGDYRFLAGRWQAGRLRLSVFDGAHAFLFDARLRPDGSLSGDFWSSDTWHETFTARRDPGARLPDGFEATRSTGDALAWGALAFPDLEGVPRTLADPDFAGRARIVQVFGSWCPNCHDASDLMAELDRTYRDRGLSIVGLAFEHTGDFERDAQQVRRYAERHGVEYPILVAGLSDKAEASKALPVLDRVRSYPTTIFLDADGEVRAIYSGFTGPATGERYTALRAEFLEIVETLLGDG